MFLNKAGIFDIKTLNITFPCDKLLPRDQTIFKLEPRTYKKPEFQNLR